MLLTILLFTIIYSWLGDNNNMPVSVRRK